MQLHRAINSITTRRKSIEDTLDKTSTVSRRDNIKCYSSMSCPWHEKESSKQQQACSPHLCNSTASGTYNHCAVPTRFHVCSCPQQISHGSWTSYSPGSPLLCLHNFPQSALRTPLEGFWTWHMLSGVMLVMNSLNLSTFIPSKKVPQGWCWQVLQPALDAFCTLAPLLN